MEKIVIALGGNALLNAKGSQKLSKEMHATEKAMTAIADFARKSDAMIVITHGNGTQVGDELLKNELQKKVPKLPLYLLNAETEGSIGSSLEIALRNALEKKGVRSNVCALLTHVVVKSNDKAFDNPTKPVGPFYTKAQLSSLFGNQRFDYVKEKQGYRRVVPSPFPKEILEIDSIEKELASGKIVIAAGGGGIPVIRKGKAYFGIDAVIDKDLASMVLANAIGAKKLVILTNADFVYRDYKKKRGAIRSIEVKEIKKMLKYLEEGTIKPKVEACVGFVEKGKGRVAYIGNLSVLDKVLQGKAGTKIY
ncbi:MAG: carbamate kinase [Candidatus Micrarchaeia archaeon]